MNQVIRDYFVPTYLEQALRQADKWQLTEQPLIPGLTVEHLALDPGGLRIMGKTLRRRRAELFQGVDLRDRAGLAERLQGLTQMAHALQHENATLRQETLDIVGTLSGFSPEMIHLLLLSFAELVELGQVTEFDGQLPSNEAAHGFVRTARGYARYYGGPLGLSTIKGLAALPPTRGNHVMPLPLLGMPELVSNIAAGNVPGISIMQALLAVLVGATTIEKNSSAEPFFGPRFLHELAGQESAQNLFPLSDLVALVTFPGVQRDLLTELIHQGDHLQVTGGMDSEKAITRLTHRLRPRSLRDFKRRISGHWHKVSFDVVAREYLTPEWLETVAHNIAFDNTMFNTQGCLSAQQVFVEGGQAEVLQFAEHYMEAMRELLVAIPKGEQPHARLRTMYQWYEGRAGFTILTKLSDIQAHPFVAVYDDEAANFAIYNALNRAIIIRRVTHLETDLRRLLGRGERRGLLQSCGVAVPLERLLPLAEILGQAGVNRLVPVGNIWDMRLGEESWDGYMAPTDLIAPQLGHWTTISFHDMDAALRQTAARNRALAQTAGE